MRTEVSNELAIKQWCNATKTHQISLLKKDAYYLFVEEAEILQPANNGLSAYSYWSEITRSGLYETVTDAEQGVIFLIRNAGHALEEKPGGANYTNPDSVEE